MSGINEIWLEDYFEELESEVEAEKELSEGYFGNE